MKLHNSVMSLTLFQRTQKDEGNDISYVLTGLTSMFTEINGYQRNNKILCMGHNYKE